MQAAGKLCFGNQKVKCVFGIYLSIQDWHGDCQTWHWEYTSSSHLQGPHRKQSVSSFTTFGIGRDFRLCAQHTAHFFSEADTALYCLVAFAQKARHLRHTAVPTFAILDIIGSDHDVWPTPSWRMVRIVRQAERMPPLRPATLLSLCTAPVSCTDHGTQCLSLSLSGGLLLMSSCCWQYFLLVWSLATAWMHLSSSRRRSRELTQTQNL